MSTWTMHADIKARILKRWDKGEFLAASVSKTDIEPVRIPLKHPSGAELTSDFDKARAWISDLTRYFEKPSGKGCNIEWRDINHRTLGRNRLPIAVVFNTIDDVAGFLGKTRDLGRFRAIYDKTAVEYPELISLMTAKPLDVLSHEESWPLLLSIATFLKQNPRPMIYLRQLEIPGVDTKFIEKHKSFLSEILTRVLPSEAIDPEARGTANFEKRYGFLSKPVRVRFRILDPDKTIMGLSDIEIPVHDFRNLTIDPETVFIVENDINGLAFPSFPKAMVIFGLGYSLDTLSIIPFLSDTAIWYWGDIDTHGFAMLDRIRHYFPGTRSFLMDEKTFVDHRPLWGTETTPTARDLPLLTPEETKVYDALRSNRLAPSIRLEQERISFTHVRQAIDDISSKADEDQCIQPST